MTPEVVTAETGFTPILRRAVERVPGAVAAIFAAWDGEAVDTFTPAGREDMLFLTAHYGIILNHIQSALHLFHFGEAEEVTISHARMDLFLRVVSAEGYYVLLAVRSGAHTATAVRETRRAAEALRAEM